MQRRGRGKTQELSADLSLRSSGLLGAICPQNPITVPSLSLDDFRLLVGSSSAAIACFEILHPFDTSCGSAEFVSNLYSRDSVCIEANGAFLGMAQERDRQSILGASVAELLPESRDWPKLFSMWHAGDLSPLPIEAELRQQDGNTWSASCALYAIYNGPNLRRVWLVARDISLLASTSRALEETELHYRSILSTPNTLSVRYDSTGFCEYASPSTISMLGLIRSDRAARPLYVQDFVHPEDISALLQPFAEKAQPRGGTSVSVRCRGRDGSFSTFLARAHRVLPRGRSSASYCDLVGERLECADLSNNSPISLSRESACLVHDLNNLLTIALAQSMPSTVTDPSEQISTIQNTLEACVALARKVSGTSPANFTSNQTTSLQEAVTHSVGLMRPLMNVGVDLGMSICGGPTMAVTCGAIDITQIVTNLVLNAKEALGESGTITVIVESELSSASTSGFGIIRVRDNGPGIPSHALGRLFEQPYTSKPDSTGHGLGLLSVKSTVDSLGGTISVESSSSGTCFSIRLPLAEVRSADRADNSVPAAPPLSILIADDEPLVRQMFTNILTGLGHSIATASDGRSLLKTLETSANVDVVILDDQMPSSRASDLATQLHFQRPGLSIIVASGDPSLRHKISPLPETISFLEKPFTRSEIVAALGAIHQKKMSGSR